jgi:hypothetical protein
MASTRKLYLPGGGTYELPLSDAMGTFRGRDPSMFRGAADGTSSTVYFLVGGAIVGGLLGWLLSRLK